MMPVIFLDFDGVLNNRHYRHGGLGVFLVSDGTLDEFDETTGRKRAGTVVGLSGDYDVMVVF